MLHEYGESHGHHPFLVGYGQSEMKKLKCTCKQACPTEKASEAGLYKTVVGQMVDDRPEWQACPLDPRCFSGTGSAVRFCCVQRGLLDEGHF